jgi:hypothetical protein
MLREPSRWQTHFGRWVTDTTPTRIVEQLRAAGTPVTPKAVYMWVSGDRLPRPEVALSLVEISGGTLSIADVYLHRHQMTALRTSIAAPLSA